MSDIDAIARMESDPNILIETAESAKTAARYAGDWIADAEAAIARVEALHAMSAGCGHERHRCNDADFEGTPCPDFGQWCSECGETWPCATIRALRGEDQ